MRRLFTFLSLFLLTSLTALAAGHLSVDGIALGRPFDTVVKDFRARGFIQKTSIDDGVLLIGRMWGQQSVAVMPMRSGDSCLMVMVVFPEPASQKPRELFSLYNHVRARVTDVYGYYGREQNLYIDERLNDFSPIEDKIKAARYEQAILYTEFVTPEGGIDVSINSHEATGLGVFAIFRDNDYVESQDDLPPGITIEENKAIEPTRCKGVLIDRPVADVVAELLHAGLRDEMTWMERQIFRKNHIVRLRGEYFGMQPCDFTIHDDGGQVEIIDVRFPAMTSWRHLFALYSSLREAIVTQYGSIYRNDDQVCGLTDNLADCDNARALQAIRSGNAHLETLLLNAYDNHAFKVVISYFSTDNTYRVSLIYYTPQGLAKRVGV